MQEADFNRIISGVEEESLLMGIHTKKEEANAFEDEYNTVITPLQKHQETILQALPPMNLMQTRLSPHSIFNYPKKI